jgi:hypothetical protein
VILTEGGSRGIFLLYERKAHEKNARFLAADTQGSYAKAAF